MLSTFSFIFSNKRPSELIKKSTIGVKVNTKKYLLTFDSLLEAGAIYVQILDFSKSFDEGLVDMRLGMSILLTKLLVYAILTDFHLVWLISHSSRFEAVIHSFLDTNIDIVLLIVLSDAVKMDGIAVDINGILTVSKYCDVLVEIFGVERILIEKIAQLVFVNENGLLKEGFWVMVFLKSVVLENLVLKMQ